MNKIVKKISTLVVALNCLFLNFCYADEIDPMYHDINTPKISEPVNENNEYIAVIIIAGVVVVLISFIAIFVLKKSQDNKNKSEQ